jgi:hypothetical protein
VFEQKTHVEVHLEKCSTCGMSIHNVSNAVYSGEPNQFHLPSTSLPCFQKGIFTGVLGFLIATQIILGILELI